MLVFRRLAEKGEVWAISTKGALPEKSPLPIKPLNGPAVSPDGTQVAFVGNNYKAEIWVMTGLLGNDKGKR